jgi:hypothetical protein
VTSGLGDCPSAKSCANTALGRYAVPTIQLRQSLGAHLADFVQIIGGSPYNATVIPHAAILGSLMPATDYTSNRRGRQRLLLNVAVVAWLSIMVMPCSVLAAGSVEAESPSVESVQPDCHGMHAESKTTANAARRTGRSRSAGRVPDADPASGIRIRARASATPHQHRTTRLPRDAALSNLDRLISYPATERGMALCALYPVQNEIRNHPHVEQQRNQLRNAQSRWFACR